MTAPQAQNSIQPVLPSRGNIAPPNRFNPPAGRYDSIPEQPVRGIGAPPVHPPTQRSLLPQPGNLEQMPRILPGGPAHSFTPVPAPNPGQQMYDAAYAKQMSQLLNPGPQTGGNTPVYAGGSPNFDERTGTYTSAPPGDSKAYGQYWQNRSQHNVDVMDANAQKKYANNPEALAKFRQQEKAYMERTRNNVRQGQQSAKAKNTDRARQVGALHNAVNKVKAKNTKK